MSENRELSTSIGSRKDLEAVKLDLRHAEADLAAAQGAEQKAEHEIEEAVREIDGAERELREIHFEVDGEKFETRQRYLTPNQIIREFGKQDPATNYLIQIKGAEKISYKGKGDEEIKMHDGMHFQIISTGPKPVSDGGGPTGFAEGLRALGYEPQFVPNLRDHVFFDYLIEIGRFAGRVVRLGLIVPADFPMIPPAGPHVSPHIQAIHPANDLPHPLGGVHASNSQQFELGAGGSWQYWSRPFVNWAESKRTVSAYMAHIWRLWETQ